MRVTRVHVAATLAAGAHVALPTGPARHLARVLRIAVGDPVVLFNGDGHDYAGAIASIRGDEVRVAIESATRVASESPLATTLVQGISRGERMDWVLQKATELGVTRIVPVLTERSVVRLDAAQAARKHEHWLGIVVAACEQCGRATLPTLLAPQPLDRWWEQSDPAAQRHTLAPGAAVTLVSAAAGAQRVELLIGPEGGLSSVEVELASGAGYSPVRLGPRILRTETAAVAALTLLQGLAGDLR